MHEARGRGRQGMVGNQRDREPPDDWFGDISEQDWNEDAELVEERSPAPARHQGSTAETYPERVVRPAAAPSVDTAEDRRADIRRRRAVAGVVLLLLIGAAATAAVLLLGDGSEPTVTPEPEPPAVTTPTETGTVTTPPPPTPTPTPPTPPPPPPSETVTTFTLPEGVKLQRDPSAGDTGSDLTVSTDPELIADLQRALAAAGFDPGTPDGSFGENTEAAVIAFQQANGLTPDGIVGPATAEALNAAIARG